MGSAPAAFSPKSSPSPVAGSPVRESSGGRLTDLVSHSSISLSFKSSITASLKSSGKLQARDNRPRPAVSCYGASDAIAASSQRRSFEFDVVIIGAGIIGLTIAREFLIRSDLSVAVVDKAVPCSGATGAGQGYIWMAHQTPGSEMWNLTMRSYERWSQWAESLRDQGLNPLEDLGWKKTGSLLVGRTPEELEVLKGRVQKLSKAGLRAVYLSSHDLRLVEPELLVGENSGAAFLPDDSQLDAHLAVAFIEKANREFASQGRYAEFFYDPVKSLSRCRGSGEIEAVETSKNTIYSKKAVVVAAGCWSGSVLFDLLKGSNAILNVPVKPRKGHLLVIENFDAFQLNHGLMELGYVKHRSLSSLQDPANENLSVSMTATMDTRGNLVLGSSRQFSGFNTEPEESIIESIWDRASEFFPNLRKLNLSDYRSNRKVRIGLRPFMPDGKPMIGPVPGITNMFIASGHEGGGLSMALGTAEMISDMVLGNPGKVEVAPFAVQGRC